MEGEGQEGQLEGGALQDQIGAIQFQLLGWSSPQTILWLLMCMSMIEQGTSSLPIKSISF